MSIKPYENNSYNMNVDFSNNTRSAGSISSLDEINSIINPNNELVSNFGTGISIENSGEIDSATFKSILSDLTNKLEQEKQELKDTKKNRGWLSSIGNGISEAFGGGNNSKQIKINDLEKQLNSLKTNPGNLPSVYKNIMGKSLDVKVISTLQESNALVKKLSKPQNSQIQKMLNQQYKELESQFENTKKENGWISGTWDKFKNGAGVGASSNKTQTQLNEMKKQLDELKDHPEKLAEAYKNITGKSFDNEELTKLANSDVSLSSSSKASAAIKKYSKGQKMATDVVADIAAGTVAIAAVAAAPFTGGTSLLLAAGVGATMKVGLKASDCIGTTKKYGVKDVAYDAITGSINGAMAPVTAGAGGAAGTSVAKAFGIDAIETTAKTAITQTAETTGKEIIQETAESTAEKVGKSLLTNILEKQGTEYVLQEGTKTTAKTLFGKTLANGADKAVDGALSGATDGFARDLGKGKIENMPEDILNGAIGGLIGAPIIGSGFKFAGKASNKISDKIGLNKTIEKNAILSPSSSESKAASQLGGLSAKITAEDSAATRYLKNLPITKQLNLSKEDISALSKIMESGSVESSNIEMLLDLVQSNKVNPKTLKNLCATGSMNKNVSKDIDTLYDAYINKTNIDDAFVPTVKNPKEHLKKSAIGDVFEVAGNKNVYIKTGENSCTQLKISKSKYLELFPPVERFSSTQGNSGDCYLVSSLSAMMDNPKSRATLLSSFTEQGDDILIKLPQGKVTRIAKNGNFPENKNMDTLMSGSKGMQLLEETYGAELKYSHAAKFADATTKATEKFAKELETYNQKITEANTTIASIVSSLAQKQSRLDEIQKLMTASPILAKKYSKEFSAATNEVSTLQKQIEEQKKRIQLNKFLVTKKNETIENYNNNLIEFIKQSATGKVVIPNHHSKFLEQDNNGVKFITLEEAQAKTNDNFKNNDDYYRGNGGYYNKVFEKFGFNTSILSPTANEKNVKNMLTNNDENKNYIFSGGTIDKGQSETTIDRNNSLYSEHAYQIKPFQTETGETRFNIVNPWNTSHEVSISFDQLKEYFQNIGATKIN